MRQILSPVGGKGAERTRLFPNGEVVIFREKIRHNIPPKKAAQPQSAAQLILLSRLFLMMRPDPLHGARPGWFVASLFMGLSLVRNFDIATSPVLAAHFEKLSEAKLASEVGISDGDDDLVPSSAGRGRYGGKGITRRSARFVRCAAHLMQKTYGRGRLTFATTTVPDMPVEQLRAIHQSWNKVVEIYRLGVKRVLREQGLRGEVLTVSEIQGKRHKKTGIPILHTHSVFVGRLPYGGWALTTERHDELWRNAILSVVKKPRCHFRSAANLQEVRTSASAYLGKYMTKSGPEIEVAIKAGFAEWLPRQWWNSPRSLLEWVKAETVESSEVSSVLIESARANDKSVWEFYGEVGIDIGWGQHYWLASYGRLSAEKSDELRRFLGWQETRKSERKGLAFVAAT